MVTNFNRYAECCLVPLPVHKIEAANLRLGRMLEKKGSFPNLAATQQSALGRSGGEAQTT
jgi:hypothetical protein